MVATLADNRLIHLAGQAPLPAVEIAGLPEREGGGSIKTCITVFVFPMIVIQRVVVLALLLSVAACEPTASPPAAAKAESPEATTPPVRAPSNPANVQPKTAAVANAARPNSPVVKPPVTVVQAKPPTPVATPQSAPEAVDAPLDLSLQLNVFDPLQPLAPLTEESHLLPPLFGEKIEPDNAFQLNGKLISNEQDDDYWQSVEGAQLQFEFKQ